MTDQVETTHRVPEAGNVLIPEVLEVACFKLNVARKLLHPLASTDETDLIIVEGGQGTNEPLRCPDCCVVSLDCNRSLDLLQAGDNLLALVRDTNVFDRNLSELLKGEAGKFKIPLVACRTSFKPRAELHQEVANIISRLDSVACEDQTGWLVDQDRCCKFIEDQVVLRANSGTDNGAVRRLELIITSRQGRLVLQPEEDLDSCSPVSEDKEKPKPDQVVVGRVLGKDGRTKEGGGGDGVAEQTDSLEQRRFGGKSAKIVLEEEHPCEHAYGGVPTHLSGPIHLDRELVFVSAHIFESTDWLLVCGLEKLIGRLVLYKIRLKMLFTGPMLERSGESTSQG